MPSEKAIYDYKGVIADFSSEIQDWLMDVYLEHGHQIERRLKNILKDLPEYLLSVSEEDYRCVARKAFPILLKKLPYLSSDDERLYTLLKEIRIKFSTWTELISINEAFDTWIIDTKDKYGVDLVVFADTYVLWWSCQEQLWEKRCKVFSKEWDTHYYDWRLAKDPFRLNEFYLKNQNSPFIEGHKRDLELLFTYMYSIDAWLKWEKQALKEYIDRFLKAGAKETVICKEATARELGIRWKDLINAHPNDNQWTIWKDEFINGNIDGIMRTFFAFAGDRIVGEITLLSEKQELKALCIDPDWQGQGIATQLIRYVESWAIQNEIKCLQFSVEPNQVRSMQIFFHWGYNEFVSNDDNVLTYRKTLQ